MALWPLVLACVMQARLVPPAYAAGDVPRRSGRESRALQPASSQAGSIKGLRLEPDALEVALDAALSRPTVPKPILISMGHCASDPCEEKVLVRHLTGGRTPLLFPVALGWLLMGLSSRAGAERRLEALAAQATLVELTLERSRHSGSGPPPKAPPRFVIARF